MYTSDLEKNKAIILHFDKACIEQNDTIALDDLVSDEVINHATPQGLPNGKDSFHHFLNALHTGLSDIKVTVLRQIAENDLVVTHKVISGIHSGNLFGLPATGNQMSIEAIEIIRLQNGRYVEHWVQSNMAKVLGNLQGH
ncbi:ester cyclase [Chitinophaga filiformis]|uniref:Ester cyclase n=1 Tax=Chitinophaga filiformis TaxID=104663 RepID=A0ABY4HX48_CHIFI|nr:ester cyclase [Chitinophaga filiformis]UPK67619.1 ester cyclase [Chitinophaga filiformis]